MVKQPALPDIKLTFGAIMEFLRPRRKLNPFRRDRPVIAAQPKNCTVLAHISRGWNIPTRASSGVVNPVVRLRFQNGAASSSVREGSDPEFGDALQLPFTPPNGIFAPTALAACNDQLQFDLYDQFVIADKVIFVCFKYAEIIRMTDFLILDMSEQN